MFHDIIFSRLGCTKGSHQWWGTTFHWWKLQKILESSRSGPPNRYNISSSTQWSSWNIKQANQEHLSKDCPQDGKRMERETSRSFMGISYGLQNSHRYDTLPIGIWKDMPSTRRIGIQITLGS
jgi:hypothetical protein